MKLTSFNFILNYCKKLFAGAKFQNSYYRQNRLIAYSICQTFLCDYPIYAFNRFM